MALSILNEYERQNTTCTHKDIQRVAQKLDVTKNGHMWRLYVGAFYSQTPRMKNNIFETWLQKMDREAEIMFSIEEVNKCTS